MGRSISAISVANNRQQNKRW